MVQFKRFLGSVIIQLCSDVSSYRPNTGRSPFEEEKADLLHKYNKISLPDAGESSMNTMRAAWLLLASSAKSFAISCQYTWTDLALAFTNPSTVPADPGQSGVICSLSQLVLLPPPRMFLKVLWFCSFSKTKIYIYN